VLFSQTITSQDQTPQISKSDRAQNFILLSQQSKNLALEALNKPEARFIDKLMFSKYDKHAEKMVEERACNHLANSIYFTVQAINNGGVKVNNKAHVPNLLEAPVEFLSKKEVRKKLHKAMHKKAKNTLSKNDCKNLAELMLNQGIFNQALNQMSDKDAMVQKLGQSNFLRALKQTTSIQPNKAMLKYKYTIANTALTELNTQLIQEKIVLPEYLKWDIENLAQQFDKSFGKNINSFKPIK
jgi:hypothetical protein